MRQPAKKSRTDAETSRGPALWQLQGDLATVACYAAREIDDLLLGRQGGFGAVGRLVEILGTSLVSVADPTSPKSLPDPTIAIVVDYALADSQPDVKTPLKTIDEVIEEARHVCESLGGIAAGQLAADRPERRAEAERLRWFCLAVANRALAFEEPLGELPSPPEES